MPGKSDARSLGFGTVAESRLAVQPSVFRCRACEGDRGAAWTRVSGKLDLATAPAVESGPARGRGSVRNALDLRGLIFTDSAGIRVILEPTCGPRRAGVGWCSCAPRHGLTVCWR